MASKFEKRHYEAVAEIFRVNYPLSGDGLDRSMWEDLQKEFSDMFAAENGRFRPVQFLEACKPERTKKVA